MVEKDLKEQYDNSVSYKYYLGKFLNDCLEKYQISQKERRFFWDEIKEFASTENRTRNEGKNSKTRSFYEQCYIISNYDITLVKKLSWRQWQDLLDRTKNREDDRLFLWINKVEDKIREDDWREFEKALNLYISNKDTSVFTDEELFDIYSQLMNMAKEWRFRFNNFSKANPKSAKIKTKGKRSTKFYKNCLLSRIDTHTLSENEYNQAFNIAMS